MDKIDLQQHVDLLNKGSIFPSMSTTTSTSDQNVEGKGGQGLDSILGGDNSLRVPASASVVPMYNKLTHKRCIRCREVQPRDRFGDHNSADGKQSICFDCKNAAGKARRDVNVRARLRHHMSTRIVTQLGPLCPPYLTRDLEKYLGYSFTELIRYLSAKLKEDYPGKRLVHVLQEGWHVDHLYPLSRYKVVDEERGVVDWEAFRQCWAITNLAAIPAEDNLKKGAKVIEFPTDDDEKPI